MKKLAICLVAALGLTATQAQAFFIEPFLGYEMGHGDSDDLSGIQFGARLGGNTLGFMYGVDYTKATLENDQTNAETDTTDLGVVVGYEFPILLRAYYVHFLKSETDSDLEGDGGSKIGIGYTGLPFLAINFEMITRKYDELNGASIAESEVDTYAISLSIPLP